MSRVDSWIDNKVAQNLFIWVFLYLIFLTTIQAENKALTAFFAILLLAPPVYINNLFIVPFLRKKIGVFLALFLINIVLFTAVSVGAIVMTTEQAFELGMYVNFFGILVLAMLFASTVKIARDSFTRRQYEREAELKLLKAQLNPHFLFNTLNNLYGLSVIKSDKLPNLMLKLSDLLRYSLYDTKETYVPLEKEIQYLENYMSLEKIRLEDTTKIQLMKTGNFSSKRIAPMLLIVFVENAFKHLNTADDMKGEVSVTIRENENGLFFRCSNTFLEDRTASNELEKGRSGIGLLNAEKRLSLIYPEKYQLKTTIRQHTYQIDLNLITKP